MSERFGTTPTDEALIALARATMKGQDVHEAAQGLSLHLADRVELYDSLAFVLRLVFDAVGGATGMRPAEVAENVAELLAAMPRTNQAPLRRTPLRMMN